MIPIRGAAPPDEPVTATPRYPRPEGPETPRAYASPVATTPEPTPAGSDVPKVVLLCGGRGTRLQEETEYRPKPMVEVGGRPVLWHIMKLFAHHGLSRFVICVGYRGEMIKDYFLDYEAWSNDF